MYVWKGPNCSHQREKIVAPQNPLRGGVRHMVLPLLRVCGTVQQNPHMRALVSVANSTVEQKEKYRPQVLAKCVCTHQSWCSQTFALNVVGTAIAIVAGWGSLGGGVTQIFMMSVLFSLMVASGMEPNTAWHVSMVVPAVIFVICAICMKLMCWDMPTTRNHDPAVTGNTPRPSMWDYVDVLRDVPVVVMMVQYSACFSTELAKNKHLVKHFRTYFQMDASSALAGAFGLMDLFARSFGGISSDSCFKHFGFPGRIWAQFLAGFFEAFFPFSFEKVDNSQLWYVALAVLVRFSLLVQMAAGTSFGVMPFIGRKQLAVVFALVGVARSLSVVTATADADSTNVDAGLGLSIAGIGMLVGICWHTAFETAFETVAEDTVLTDGW